MRGVTINRIKLVRGGIGDLRKATVREWESTGVGVTPFRKFAIEY